MAGLDGVKNKINPGKPTDINIYEAPESVLAKIPSTPGSLAESLDALEKDHKYLLKGEVFTKDNIETYINFKREICKWSKTIVLSSNSSANRSINKRS